MLLFIDNIIIDRIQDEINELKTNINKLNKKLDDKEEREYIITILKAVRNMEYYIIKKNLCFLNSDEIRNYEGGYNQFKKNNQYFISEIQYMEDEFGLTANKQNIIKINENIKINNLCDQIDIEELEKACNKFCEKYNELTELYKGYLKYREHVENDY